MQAFGIAPSIHHTASKLIDDDNFIVFDDVIDILGKQRMRSQRLIYMMYQRDIFNVVQRGVFRQEVCGSHQRFDMMYTGFG